MKTTKLKYSLFLAFFCAFLFIACNSDTHKKKDDAFSFAPLSVQDKSQDKSLDASPTTSISIALHKTKFNIKDSSPTSSTTTKENTKDAQTHKVTLIYYMPSECLSCNDSLTHLNLLAKNVPLLDIKIIASDKLKDFLKEDYTGKLPIYIDTTDEGLKPNTKQDAKLAKKDFMNSLETNLGVDIKPDQAFYVLLDKNQEAVKSYEGIILEENLELDARALIAK
ncbi:hypothetical protein BKH43_07130 [Helicobacter sp. 13S00401-1]|uniref:hypothetical protein n=1 Tax=Helicobacter sp. 13S00401-1 TaxID=1905758 RepID=UPI000BA69E16|nr:hypothetical protein [Helicobacter sp. 13S00401-1]PAF49291.1 hypothetical protein BKH43_07130 [Helicobacter sp. 13S00401-1]